MFIVPSASLRECHLLVLDGVYVRDAAGKLVFHALSPPTTDEVTEVAVRTAIRLQKVLARHGRLLDDGAVDSSPRAEQLALSTLVSAAASGLGLVGSALASRCSASSILARHAWPSGWARPRWQRARRGRGACT